MHLLGACSVGEGSEKSLVWASVPAADRLQPVSPITRGSYSIHFAVPTDSWYLEKSRQSHGTLGTHISRDGDSQEPLTSLWGPRTPWYFQRAGGSGCLSLRIPPPRLCICVPSLCLGHPSQGKESRQESTLNRIPNTPLLSSELQICSWSLQNFKIS